MLMMKTTKMTGGLAGPPLLLTALLLFLTAWAVPALGAGELSPGLEAGLRERIPSPSERDLVVKSVSRALASGVGEAQLEPVIERSLEDRISPEGLSAMIDTIARARERGLPTEPFTGKIMEGLAKKVGEDRILRALRKVGERMDYAAGLVGGGDLEEERSAALITRTADAVAAGMKKKDLEEIIEVMATKRVNRNIEPEEVMELVKAASGYGVGSGRVSNFAISLMENEKADLDDVRKYLERLSRNAYRREYGGDDSIGGDGDDDGGGDDDAGESDDHDDSESDDGDSDDHESEIDD